MEALKGKTVVQAACGGSHTLFVTSDGHAYAAGRAEYVMMSQKLPMLTSLKRRSTDGLVCGCCFDPSHGRLGVKDTKTTMVPMLVDLGSIPVRQVSAGGAHSFALLHSTRQLFSPMISPLSSKPVPPRDL